MSDNSNDPRQEIDFSDLTAPKINLTEYGDCYLFFGRTPRAQLKVNWPWTTSDSDSGVTERLCPIVFHHRLKNQFPNAFITWDRNLIRRHARELGQLNLQPRENPGS